MRLRPLLGSAVLVGTFLAFLAWQYARGALGAGGVLAMIAGGIAFVAGLACLYRGLWDADDD